MRPSTHPRYAGAGNLSCVSCRLRFAALAATVNDKFIAILAVSETITMTVGLVIVSHSAQLAAGVAELAGQMSQGKTPIAIAGGAINDVLGTTPDKILAGITAVDGPDGVLVLLDLGSAILSA